MSLLSGSDAGAQPRYEDALWAPVCVLVTNQTPRFGMRKRNCIQRFAMQSSTSGLHATRQKRTTVDSFQRSDPESMVFPNFQAVSWCRSKCCVATVASRGRAKICNGHQISDFHEHSFLFCRSLKVRLTDSGRTCYKSTVRVFAASRLGKLKTAL